MSTRRSRSQSLRHDNARRSRSRSRERKRRHRSRSRSRNRSRSRSRSRDRAASTSNDQKDRKKVKKAKKEKKSSKKDDRERYIEVPSGSTSPPTAPRQPSDITEDVDAAKENVAAVAATPQTDVKSFFAQLRQQEAVKDQVGTIHARGIQVQQATAVTDEWECIKRGCGNKNSKYATACNKCGAMKRMSESQPTHREPEQRVRVHESSRVGMATLHDVLRTGVLFKKGSGQGAFGRKNWKPRYFVLTPARLKYYTFEDGELKGELDLSQCDESVIEVMPADSMKTGNSASTIWRIAINAPERRLLLAAGTEMEMNDWVDKLIMAFRITSGKFIQQPAPQPVDNGAEHYQERNPPVRDFQNFAGSVRRSTTTNRRSVTDRLSDEQRRSYERERHEAERLAREEAERRAHAEEQARAEQHLLEAAERHQQKQIEADLAIREESIRIHEERKADDLQSMQRESMLDLQRRQKREQHERERIEAQRALEESERQETLMNEFDGVDHTSMQPPVPVQASIEYEVVRRAPKNNSRPSSPAHAPSSVEF
ncbi:TPA: hypothetical protein N0F65_006151 [Lagenidium giganteum]|uniref:PH domain-containing protein n=1 Tax=Lagenidium giganteum TaxID=4803 RepID=A0AAV2Z3H7_9STRA|nr:TPA: hypothetical protein N0F65_006151 [Lagenidium giganteum]